MAPSGRVRHLLTTCVAFATYSRVRRTTQVLLAVGLIFVVIRLRTIWHDSTVDLGRVGWFWVAGAIALAAGSVWASALVWLEILRGLDTAVRRHWVGIFLQAQ